MTCCSGSSVSSAAETMKVASFSSSLIVGSVLTSFSNCSSGTSSKTFLPSGPTAATSAWICSAVFVAVALLAFLAGILFAAALFAGVGEADFLTAVCLAVVLDELEDTNYLSIVVQELFRKLRGRDKARTCQQPHAYCGMPPKSGPRWFTRAPQVHPRAAAFFSSWWLAPFPGTRRRPRRRPSDSPPGRSRPRPTPTPEDVRRAAWRATRRRSGPSACRTRGATSSARTCLLYTS